MSTARTLSGHNTSPMASAPPRAAISPSSTDVMPQIFTATRDPRDAAPAQRGSEAERISASSAAAGSSCAIRCSPIRNASYPASRRRTMSSGPRMPLSATATTSSGIAEARESAVSRSTVIVRRSRLLTPTMRAPAAQRALQLRAVVDLDQHLEAGLQRRRVQRSAAPRRSARPR